MKTMRILFVLFLLVGGLGLSACSDDDDDNPTGPGGNGGDTDPIVGTWLSEGENVAPILASFNIERVQVTFDDDGTVALSQTVTGTAPTSNSGVYTVTEAATGDVHAIAINYTGTPAFEQEGIFEVISASPDTLRLEVVQTVPDIGATPRTPADGFGSDQTLGNLNIQIYIRQ